MIKSILISINELLKWEPYMIFWEVWYTDTFSRRTDETKLELFMKRLPFLVEIIIKTIYYIITWPLYLLVKFIWLLFIGIFFPQTWFK